MTHGTPAQDEGCRHSGRRHARALIAGVSADARPRRTAGRAAAFAGLAMLLAAGCAVGPNYQPPEVQVPAGWSETRPADLATQPAAALTQWWHTLNDPLLDSLIQRAAAGNLDLRQAQARVREARALRQGATSELFPVFEQKGGYTRARQSSNSREVRRNFMGGLLGSLVPGLNFDPGLGGSPASISISRNQNGLTSGSPGVAVEQDLYQLGFDASWEVDVFGAVRRSIEASRADVAAAEEARRDVLVSVMAEVAWNYLEVRVFQKRLQVARANIAFQQDALDLTRSRFDAGLINELDVVQAQAQLSTTQSQVPLLESGLRQAAYRLAVLLGQHPGALWSELEEERAIPRTPPDLPEALPSDLLRRRPDIRRAERELAAATARIGVATADLFPRFSLNGSFAWESADSNRLFEKDSRAWSIGPGIRWRLLDGGAVLSNIEIQNAREEQAVIAYERTVLNSLEETENAMVAYARERMRYRTLRTAVDANRRAVEMANTLYSRGVADFLRVLESQRSLYLVEDQLIQSERAVVANLIALYKALGGGWDPEAK